MCCREAFVNQKIVCVTAQLIDALTGKHLWAERYDRELKDIFAIQDEITKKIIVALQVKLTAGGLLNMSSNRTDNLDAYLKNMQGISYWERMNIASLNICRATSITIYVHALPI